MLSAILFIAAALFVFGIGASLYRAFEEWSAQDSQDFDR